MKRYFTWDQRIWDEKTKYNTIEEAFANQPKSADHLKRVLKSEHSSAMYAHLVNAKTIERDVADKHIDKAQGKKETESYLAWCKGSTSDCVSDSPGSKPGASTSSKIKDI